MLQRMAHLWVPMCLGRPFLLVEVHLRSVVCVGCVHACMVWDGMHNMCVCMSCKSLCDCLTTNLVNKGTHVFSDTQKGHLVSQ